MIGNCDREDVSDREMARLCMLQTVTVHVCPHNTCAHSVHVPVLMAQGEDSMESFGTVESPAAHPLSFSYTHIINTFVHVNLYVVMALSSVVTCYTYMYMYYTA